MQSPLGNLEHENSDVDLSIKRLRSLSSFGMMPEKPRGSTMVPSNHSVTARLYVDAK
jgi:hypothetical protein